MAGEEEISEQVRAQAARELGQSEKPFIYHLTVVAHQSYQAQVQLEQRVRAEFPPPSPIECAEGCAFCCHITVAVTIAEVAAIMHAVARWPREEVTALGARVEELAKQRKEMSIEQLRKSRTPCVLLDEKRGACRVYQARPLRCRGFNSMAVKKCESHYFGGPSDAPVYLPQMLTANAVYTGVRAAVAERLKTTPMLMHLELVAALDIAFSLTPEQWSDPAAWQAAATMNATPEMWSAMMGERADDPDA